MEARRQGQVELQVSTRRSAGPVNAMCRYIVDDTLRACSLQSSSIFKCVHIHGFFIFRARHQYLQLGIHPLSTSPRLVDWPLWGYTRPVGFIIFLMDVVLGVDSLWRFV